MLLQAGAGLLRHEHKIHACAAASSEGAGISPDGPSVEIVGVLGNGGASVVSGMEIAGGCLI